MKKIITLSSAEVVSRVVNVTKCDRLLGNGFIRSAQTFFSFSSSFFFFFFFFFFFCCCFTYLFFSEKITE